jgi:hypothetical protein
MLDEKLVGKLRDIFNELSILSNEIACKIDKIEKKGDSDLSVYIASMKKCHLAFKKKLEILEDSSEFYKKDLEIRDDHNSLDYLRHDMLNPISGLKGYSELILETNIDPYIVTNINEMTSITTSMLDLISHIKI